MNELTPRQVVAELDRYIVGQAAAKRAVAVAIRNRWRRLQLPAEMRPDVAPKNILMIGPTGVGKTEIARRLAQLVRAPFIKVEATKFTEVGYHGRDVDTIIRDLLEMAINMVRGEQAEIVRQQAEKLAEESLLETLLPGQPETDNADEAARHERSLEKLRARLRAGEMEDKVISIKAEQKMPPVGMIAAGIGVEQLDPEIQNFMERLMPPQARDRRLTVREARPILIQQASDRLLDREKIIESAVERTENSGVVFLDELDKVCGTDRAHGPDISRQGVQRDLLPIIEGSTVSTRHGPVRTHHILFIAAGAFHQSKPSDLMPELQGRLPIRVELSDLTREDFRRILTEPQNALTRQQVALMSTEKVTLKFTDDAVDALADIASRLNRDTQNIGARRLHTIVEKVLEDISFDAPQRAGETFTIDAALVRERLSEIVKDEDLSRFIL